MRSHGLIGVLGTLLIGVSTAATAQNAFTARPLNIHAGPDREYPVVTRLDAGAPVAVNGCLDDWSWCDVSFDDSRGWAYAPGLSYVYQGDRVALYSYAPGLGIPVVTFSLGTYWDHYYRGRPWYGQRTMWMNRHIEHQRPPGPRPQAHPPMHAHAGRPEAAGPRAAQRGEPRAGEAGRYAEKGAEARERGTAERDTGNIRSADRRGERPAAKSSNTRPEEHAKSDQHQAPEKRESDKREPPPG
jgi:uncharacterized protein YraI